MSKRPFIPLSEPYISGNEWKYVKECLDTGWVSSVGSYVDRFEAMVADYVGTRYAVAAVNGTAALHLSLLACGVMAGDEVIVPTLTFIASANVVRYCGAYPIFMDCELETLCLDVQKAMDFIAENGEKRRDGYTYNKITGRKIKAIIPVHIFGHPVDMDPLIKLCREQNIRVIEDATESLGSEYKGKKTGSLGDIGCFSFNGNKIITTGGGGMVTTNDKNMAERIRHLSTQAKVDLIEYDHDEIGFNYRLTNMQAAMGVAQMEKLKEILAAKRENASRYRSLLKNIPEVVFSGEKPWASSNFWLYAIQVDKKCKERLIPRLLKENIQIRPVWKLIHTLPMYCDFQNYKIEAAWEAYERNINIPSSVGLSYEDIEFVTSCIGKYCKEP